MVESDDPSIQMERLEPIPAVRVRVSVQPGQVASLWKANTQTTIHTHCQFTITNYNPNNVFGLWEEAILPKKKPLTDTGRTYKYHGEHWCLLGICF